MAVDKAGQTSGGSSAGVSGAGGCSSGDELVHQDRTACWTPGLGGPAVRQFSVRFHGSAVKVVVASASTS